MNGFLRTLTVLVGFGWIIPAVAQVIPILPDGEVNLAAAVAAAADGDEISLAAGTYEISGEIAVDKAIAIAAAEGVARDCVIVTNVTGTSRLFTLSSPGASLRGITLTGGVETYGGAVLLQSGTITNCVLSGNRTTGVYPSTSASGGAVLLVADGKGQVVDSLFSYNGAVQDNSKLGGGAVAATARKATEAVIRCKFIKNTSFWGGAAYGIYLFDPEFVSHRKEGDQRGGLFANNCTVFRAKISPFAERFMGGIFYDCTVYDTFFSGIVNSSGDGLQNGVALVQGGKLYNCTFTKCQSNSGFLGKNAEIYNSICWGNINQPGFSGGKVEYNCLEKPIDGTGNIFVNPQLSDTGELGSLVCINKAMTTVQYYFPEAELRTVDAAGKPRNALGGVDLGCFERQSLDADALSAYIERESQFVPLGSVSSFTVLLVAPPKTAVELNVDYGDGCTKTLTHVMSGYNDSVVIEHTYVRTGAFTPSVTARVGSVSSADSASNILSVLSPATHLYVSPAGDDVNDGLAPGSAKRTLYQAYMAASDGATIHLLAGDHVVGEATIMMDKPISIVGAGTSSTCFAADSGLVSLVCNNANLSIRDIAFEGLTNNVSLLVMSKGTASSLSFKSCKTEKAAMISMADVAGMTLSDVTISHCYAKSLVSGGNRSNVKALNVRIADSWGTDYGSAFTGVSLYRCRVERVIASKCLLINCAAYDCLLSENQVGGGTAEGILRNTSAYNCTVVNNRSNGTSPTVIARNYSHYNSIFYGNRNYDSKGNATVMGCYTENATFYNCWIEEGTENCVEGDTKNIYGSNLVLARDFRLKYNSPCIDAGNNEYFPNPTLRTVDLAGNQRIRSGSIDLGCFEYDPQGMAIRIK